MRLRRLAPPRLAPAALAVLALTGGAGHAQEPVPAGVEQAVAARGGGLAIGEDELEEVLLARYAMSRAGREVLKLLVEAELLDRIARRRGWKVDEKAVDAEWAELDRNAKLSGESDGMRGLLRKQGLGVAEFRRYLWLVVIQKRMTREALGLEPDAPVTGEQQTVWIEQEKANRGLRQPPPPWEDDVAATCGDFEITAERYGEMLRQRLPREDVLETCWHLLLVEGVERRMPDLSDDAVRQGVEDEIARRRQKHQELYPQISFEQAVAARGSTMESFRSDPSITIATLSRLWVDRTHGDEGLRKAYEDEREFFEGRYGKAARTHLLFLVAAKNVNQLNPRDYGMAEDELEEMRDRIGNLDDFEALAAKFSEEPETRERRGELGWVTRAGPEFPAPVRDAVFRYLDSTPALPVGGTALGPVRLDTGCALLWVSRVRQSPGWPVMAEHVHEVLRARFLRGILEPTDVEYLLQ